MLARHTYHKIAPVRAAYQLMNYVVGKLKWLRLPSSLVFERNCRSVAILDKDFGDGVYGSMPSWCNPSSLEGPRHSFRPACTHGIVNGCLREKFRVSILLGAPTKGIETVGRDGVLVIGTWSFSRKREGHSPARGQHTGHNCIQSSIFQCV